MIEILKGNKKIILVVLAIIILFFWNFLNSKNEINSIENNELNVAKTNSTEENSETEENIIVVHVTGEVKNPGIVKVKEGSRIEDIIEAAGGLTENSDITNVNLAYLVEDGMKIRIPSNDDGDLPSENYISSDSGEGILIGNDEESNTNIININKATQTDLETLPGIGPSLATRIIEYREQNGEFKEIEDIKNVGGIGDIKFDKIKEYIKVK